MPVRWVYKPKKIQRNDGAGIPPKRAKPRNKNILGRKHRGENHR